LAGAIFIPSATGAFEMHIGGFLPQAKPWLLCGIGRLETKKKLDNPEPGTYPTPSMSIPPSPDMWERGVLFVQAWTERGDLTNAREEEGGQEGLEEEEVNGCPGKGGVNDSPLRLFLGARKASVAGRKP
jgi:hypothetical protein